MLSGIARAAQEARALFLQPDIAAERARALWSHAFDNLIRKAALDRAISDAKSDSEPDVRVVMQLKTERDALERDIKSGDVLREVNAPTPSMYH